MSVARQYVEVLAGTTAPQQWNISGPSTCQVCQVVGGCACQDWEVGYDTGTVVWTPQDFGTGVHAIVNTDSVSPTHSLETTVLAVLDSVHFFADIDPTGMGSILTIDWYFKTDDLTTFVFDMNNDGDWNIRATVNPAGGAFSVGSAAIATGLTPVVGWNHAALKWNNLTGEYLLFTLNGVDVDLTGNFEGNIGFLPGLIEILFRQFHYGGAGGVNTAHWDDICLCPAA